MCNREAPSVEAASARWAGRARFIGVAWNGDHAAFQAFVDQHHLTFPQIADPDGDVFARFGIPAQPAMAIIDRHGLVARQLGPIEPATLDQALTTAGG